MAKLEQALFLAAGRGSRLGEKTQTVPKGLVKLAGTPLLEHQLNTLRASGDFKMAAVTGYKSKMIEPLIPMCFHNSRWEHTNMVSSLLQARDWLRNGDTLICYSDIVYSDSLIAKLLNSTCPILIPYNTQWRALWEARFDRPLEDAENFRVNSSQRIELIGGRANGLDLIQGQYMGLVRLTPSGWSQIECYLDGLEESVIDKMDMTTLLQSLIARNVELQGVPIDGGWYEVDDQNDLKLYEQWIQSGTSFLLQL